MANFRTLWKVRLAMARRSIFRFAAAIDDARGSRKALKDRRFGGGGDCRWVPAPAIKRIAPASAEFAAAAVISKSHRFSRGRATCLAKCLAIFSQCLSFWSPRGVTKRKTAPPSRPAAPRTHRRRR
ncbi:hypothetical protein SAMCCGM7_Ch0972 [Sinorhizobium americanum CCGM7]|nr:hypothetical protein SAMCCGM7_Ch0972 [Sinorhizobium americanum CCGM7]